MTSTELWERLLPASPAHVSDALKALGIGGAVIQGWSAADERCFVGVAVPVQCCFEQFRAVAPDEYSTAEVEAAMFPGAVPVIDGGGREAAVFGPVAAAAYGRAGVAGVVVDGGVRGLPDISTSGVPVLARHDVLLSGFGSVRRELVERVVLDGIEIRRGDVIVGAPAGIVVVPAAAVEDVSRRAAQIAGTDLEIVAGMRHGERFADLWNRSPRSRPVHNGNDTEPRESS